MATWWSPFVDVPTGCLIPAGSKGYTSPPTTPGPAIHTTRRSRSVQQRERRFHNPFDRGAVRNRLQPLAERIVRRLLPHIELDLFGHLLLRREVGCIEPGGAQRLHLLAAEPAEPALLA